MERPDSKEWQLLEKVALASVEEQKRSRRWGIFFKLLTFFYLFGLLGLFASETDSLKGMNEAKAKNPHTALVYIKGIIMDEESASANVVVGGLRKAFEAQHSQAIILAIDSPGGSPVQAGYVYDEINRLRAIYPEKKVYAVISDLGASAAYYIAAAADEIYADKASLVGSIGVISASFGFTDLLEKVGVERRVIAAGEHKAFLDPYQPLNQQEREFWQSSLEVVHKQFIEQVKKGRGDRLQDNDELFSGLIWSGEQALELGLIDGLGSAGKVARDVIGFEDIVDYSIAPDPVTAFMRKFGLVASQALYKQFAEPKYY